MSSPGVARPQDDGLGRTISRAIQAEGPFVTPAEYGVIGAKCGYRDGEWDGRSINMRGDVLICANGRRVDDPEVRAIMHEVGERVSERVDRVMNSPAVKRAIDGTVARETRAALHRFDALERPRIQRQVARAQEAARMHLSSAEMARLHADLERMHADLEQLDERIGRDVHAAMESLPDDSFIDGSPED